MSLRARYVITISAITLVTRGGAFVAVSRSVNASQERQLDLALAQEAREEAAEAATLGGDELAISDRPGPAANDVGPLTKYGVIYGPTGEILAQTPSWKGSPPPRPQLPEASGSAFDLWSDAEHLRGTHVAIPAHPGTTMLLAAPRSDLDGDEHLLLRAMATVFGLALLWTMLVAIAVVWRLTRDHRTIAAVARRVAAGDFDARIHLRGGDREVRQLAQDVDALIAGVAGGGGGGGMGGGGGKGDGAGSGGGAGETLQRAAGGKASRLIEEIKLVFERNKGAIYALYNRALREEPGLQGKVVLELRIPPSGEVLDCRVASSELQASELERKLLARVRQFDFGAKDVEPMIVSWPVDFLPS